MHIQSKTNPEVSGSEREKWFEDFIFGAKTDLLELETGTADTQKENFYNSIINEDYEEVEKLLKPVVTKNMVKRIIGSYMEGLHQEKGLLRKLAFDYNDSAVLVWAEIAEDDEKAEDALIMLEAKINARFYGHGFQITTTIVEDCDNLVIPNHYTTMIS